MVQGVNGLCWIIYCQLIKLGALFPRVWLCEWFSVRVSIELVFGLSNTGTGTTSLWRSQWQADTGLPSFQLILTFSPHLVFLLSHQLFWTVSCSRLASRLLRADPYRQSPHRGHTLTDLTINSSFCLLQGVEMPGSCGVPSYPSEPRSLKTGLMRYITEY